MMRFSALSVLRGSNLVKLEKRGGSERSVSGGGQSRGVWGQWLQTWCAKPICLRRPPHRRLPSLWPLYMQAVAVLAPHPLNVFKNWRLMIPDLWGRTFSAPLWRRIPKPHSRGLRDALRICIHLDLEGRRDEAPGSPPLLPLRKSLDKCRY